MIWFTSDTHFLHERMIEEDCGNRPFSTYKEMEEVLIYNWNTRVSNSDIIYHLGDFSLSYGKKHISKINKIISSLNGQKFLIKGNHDRKEVYKNEQWIQVCDYKEIKTNYKDAKINIVMMHYPILSWNKKMYGSFMLHGHCHGNLENSIDNLIDVGTDCHNYCPISLEHILELYL